MGKGGRGGGLMQGAAPGVMKNAMGGAMKKAGQMPPAAVNKSMFSQLPPKGGMPQRTTGQPQGPSISRGDSAPIPMGQRKEIDPNTPQRFRQGGAYGSPSTGIQQLMKSYGMGRMWR